MIMKLKERTATMKLSENTLAILKNFSGINNSILVKSGNKLRTISVAKNILAEAEIIEEFPKNFAIYDLSKFLNNLSLHNNPEIQFENESYLMIKSKGIAGNPRTNRIPFADPEVIISPPDKDITLPTKDICFELQHGVLDTFIKAASVNQIPDLSVIGSGGKVKLVARDKKNDNGEEFHEEVGETDQEFVFNFKVENLKIIPGSYQVVISSKLLSQFSNTKYNLTYYIALEPDSTFG